MQIKSNAIVTTVVHGFPITHVIATPTFAKTLGELIALGTTAIANNVVIHLYADKDIRGVSSRAKKSKQKLFSMRGAKAKGMIPVDPKLSSTAPAVMFNKTFYLSSQLVELHLLHPQPSA